MVKIDWTCKLRHGLQTMAFCLALSAIHFAFTPERPYQVPLLYALGIGLPTWAVIDFGRHLFPSALETGWPQGWGGALLVPIGIAGGYVLGTLAIDRYFGWSSWDGRNLAQLRISLLVTVLSGVAGTFLIYSRSKSAYLQRKMTEANLLAGEARLKLLESQLEPHMLFNTLANLRVLIGADPAGAQQMLDHVVAYLRATLDASRNATHTLENEFDRLRDYLELMAVRMGPRLAFSLSLPVELAQLQVPTLLLQPLVENSIRHGLEPKVEGGSVTVTARREQACIVLDVVDTGVGKAGPSLPGTGFGLAQVRERLLTLYGPASTVELIATESQGTRATILFAP